MHFKVPVLGIPWWSSGLDSVLPLQGAWVLSLVRKLRSHKMRGTKKKSVPVSSVLIHLVKQYF